MTVQTISSFFRYHSIIVPKMGGTLLLTWDCGNHFSFITCIQAVPVSDSKQK